MSESDVEAPPLEVILAYARRGWPVFPCKHATKVPLTTHGFKDAVTDEGKIAAWWRKWPNANVGIATGATSGLIVVDVDPRNGGDRSLAKLECVHGALPRDYVVASGGGGVHIYLKLPLGVVFPCSKLGKGIDIKCEGGYVIAPPSLHPSGVRYCQLGADDVPTAPRWLIEQLGRGLQAPAQAAVSVPMNVAALRVPEPIKQLIRSGDTEKHYESRSDAVYAAIRSMLKARHTDVEIEAVMMDPTNRLSERPLEIGRAELRNDIARARCKPDREDGGVGRKEHEMQAGQQKHIGASNAGQPAQYLECVRASDVTVKPVNWLWRNQIARGKFTLIAGMPGLGKSQIIIHFAAIVSIGGTWPDGTRFPEPANVVIFSAEDDPDDTLVPRLKAAGADLSRVHIAKYMIDGYDASGKPSARLPDMRKDIDGLVAKVDEIGNVAFVAFDPFSVYGGETNHAKNGEVRRLLAPLIATAADKGFALIGVTHFNKGSGDGAPREALTRVLDSIGYTAAARATFGVFKDPDDPSRRLFLPMKNNLGPDIGGFAYRLEPVMLGDIETTRVEWCEGNVSDSADDVITGAGRNHGADGPTLATAVAFLCRQLRKGPRSAVEMEARSTEAGYSEPTITRAKRIAGIRSSKCGMQGGWVW